MDVGKLAAVVSLVIACTTVQAAPTQAPPTPTAAPTAAAAPAPSALSQAVVALVRADGTTRDVRVELAMTEAQRERGLMERESVPDDTGMLFVFPSDTTVAFWMKDTPQALSIAFIAADGRIVDVQDMQPETTDLHHSPAPYRYALEVGQGYFGRVSIAPGDRVQLPPLPPAS